MEVTVIRPQPFFFLDRPVLFHLKEKFKKNDYFKALSCLIALIEIETDQIIFTDSTEYTKYMLEKTRCSLPWLLKNHDKLKKLVNTHSPRVSEEDMKYVYGEE